MQMRGGDAQGGRGDARASCASPLGTPLPVCVCRSGYDEEEMEAVGEVLS